MNLLAGAAVNSKVLPTVLIIIDACAAIMYLTEHDYRRAIYWTAAGVLTACVTY